MASRKKPARKPAVIDAEATEVSASEDAAANADTQAPDPSDETAAGTPGSDGLQAGTGDPQDRTGSEQSETEQSETEPAETEHAGTDSSEADADDPAADKKPGGRGKWIAGGLAAVLLAGVAGGGYLYRTYGDQVFGPTHAPVDVAAIDARIADAAGKANAADEKISGLSAQISKLQEALSAQTGKPDEATAGKLAELDASAGAARSAAEGASAKTAALEGTVAQLQKSLKATQSALETAAASGGGADTAALNLQIEKLAARLGQLEATRTGQGADNGKALEELKSQLAASAARVEELSGQVETLKTQLATLAETSAGQSGSTNNEVPDLSGARAAMQATVGAVNSGKPFEAELAALAQFIDTSKLPALTANAANGIASESALSAKLKGLAGSLSTETQQPQSGDSGLWGTLKGKLSSVVKVRSLDETDWAGASEDALAALSANGLSGAVKALSAHKGAMPAALAGWLTEARKRAAAAQELNALPQMLLSAPPAGGETR